MQLDFTVTAKVYSGISHSKKMHAFPTSTINRVIVCNAEGCSYLHTTSVSDGKFDVKFELKPLDENCKLSDQLKFHFYTGNKIPIVIAAGAVKMGSIIRLMKGKEIDPIKFNCNFSPVFVQLHFHPPTAPNTKFQAPKMVKSCLENSKIHGQITMATNAFISSIIKSKLDLQANVGAPMFCNLISAHNFENEVTSHINFQQDISPTPKHGLLYNRSGLTMTALAESLHNFCVTPQNVLNMKNESKEFTNFVANVCQSYMRSAHICPYVSDEVLDSQLDSTGNLNHVLSESFKIPLHEPYLENATYLCADDCEGQATFMLHLFKSFGFMYDASKQTDTQYTDMMPAILFDMTQDEKKELWNVAMKIGKCVSNEDLQCHITLVSAGGASLGDGGGQVGGHATCVLVNNVNKEQPLTQIMEGTNSMMWDDDNTMLDLSNPMIPMKMPLVQIANMLTSNIAKIMGMENKNDPDFRKLIHLNSENQSKFYKTAYCQNGNLLASNVNNALKLNYGISMEHISDTKTKVYMPITANLTNSIVRNEEAHQFCNNHRIKRKNEIHPPLMSSEKLAAIISGWSPMTMYAIPEKFAERKQKICLAMKSIRDKDERNSYLLQLNEKLKEWNNKYSDVGVCTSYVAYDTVFTRLHMWVDNVHKLEETLKKKMAD